MRVYEASEEEVMQDDLSDRHRGEDTVSATRRSAHCWHHATNEFQVRDEDQNRLLINLSVWVYLMLLTGLQTSGWIQPFALLRCLEMLPFLSTNAHKQPYP